MRKVVEISPTDFNAFVHESETIPVFASGDWLNAHNANSAMYFGVYKKEQLSSVFCFEVLKKGPFKLLINPYFTPYSGPWSKDDSNQQKDMNAMLSFLSTKSHDLQFQPSLAFEYFESTKYCKPKTTYLLNIENSEEEILANMSSTRRRNIRKAAKLDCIIEEASDEELLNFFKISAEKNNFNLSESKLTAIFQSGVKMYKPKLVYAKKTVGAIFIIADDLNAYYLGGGYDHNNSQSAHAVSYLIWESIKWAKSQAIKNFDFEGSEIEGIAEFFRKFGAEKTEYLASSNVPQAFKSMQKLKSSLFK